jgi:8-oxo-dGTP pyrophosphatase MutT (NUDIX family)
MTRQESLAELLRAYVPSDEREAEYLTRMLALLAETQDPFSQASFHPGHFTASAFVLSPPGDALLLIFHERLDRWLQPGGHVEAGDADMLAAARRELAEEVGLSDVPLAQEGIFDIDIHPIPSAAGQPEHEHFDVRFVFRAGGYRFSAGSDAKSARWVSLEAVGELGSDESVMRAVGKLREGPLLCELRR